MWTFKLYSINYAKYILSIFLLEQLFESGSPIDQLSLYVLYLHIKNGLVLLNFNKVL